MVKAPVAREVSGRSASCSPFVKAGGRGSRLVFPCRRSAAVYGPFDPPLMIYAVFPTVVALDSLTFFSFFSFLCFTPDLCFWAARCRVVSCASPQCLCTLVPLSVRV